MISIPPMAATIERRLLVNYRVDPDVIAQLLPAGLRPQLVRGSAVAGVCLIRLGQFRPRGVTPRIGHRSESAAHRIAVAWDGPDGPGTGVYILDPGQATRVRSSFFDALPAGAAAFDHVLVMRGVPVLWSSPADAAPESLVVG